jgi:hypothetical protein
MTKSRQLHVERKRKRQDSYLQALVELAAEPGHPRREALLLLSRSIAEMDREIGDEAGVSANGRYLTAMRDRLVIRFNGIYARAKPRAAGG